MTTPSTTNAVQESIKRIEALHMTHTDNALRVCGGIQPIHLMQWSILGSQNRRISAPVLNTHFGVFFLLRLILIYEVFYILNSYGFSLQIICYWFFPVATLVHPFIELA